MSEICGIVNIIKEKGFTSQDAVTVTRKLYGKVKAGHAGTLDPNAEGVLPVCLGKATKIADYIGGESKSYRGELILGKTTDTEDITGSVLTETSYGWNVPELEAAIRAFVGEISQTPPMYSAVKVNGKKLYELARAGKTVERKSRIITIHSIRLVSADPAENKAILDVDCSKGTYIRTLFADIGAKIGTGGCMGGLTRTRVGDFRIEDGVTVSRLRELSIIGESIEEYVHPVEEALPYPIARVTAQGEKRLLNGNPLPLSVCVGKDGESPLLAGIGDVFLVRRENVIAGIYDVRENFGEKQLVPRVMLL